MANEGDPDVTPHPACEQPENVNSLLWRYLDLPKLIALLESNCLILAQLQLLKDPHEGSLTRPVHKEWHSLLDRVGNGAEVRNVRNEIRRMAYVSCWHMNEVESEAMWRLYCPNDQGVALQTTYSKLYTSMTKAHCQMGVVKYIDYVRESFLINNFAVPIMHKRESFKHENEVRVLRLEVKRRSKSNETPVLKIPWVIEDIIDHVYINPYADQWYHDVVISVLNKFCPILTERVKWSTMRVEPLY